jgi:flavodoxin
MAKEDSMKSLVIYYSRKGKNYVNGAIRNLKEGNTEVVAKKIVELTGADLFEVEPVKEYSTDYYECTKEAKDELENNERPELKHYLDSIDEYEVIYLGYPCWWGTYPRAMATFLDRYDFNGKKIKPFCTHEGSAMGISMSELSKTLVGANIASGLALKGSDVHKDNEELVDWIKE